MSTTRYFSFEFLLVALAIIFFIAAIPHIAAGYPSTIIIPADATVARVGNEIMGAVEISFSLVFITLARILRRIRVQDEKPDA